MCNVLVVCCWDVCVCMSMFRVYVIDAYFPLRENMLVSASIRGPLDIHHADDTKRRQHTTGANDPIPETCLIFAYYAHSKSTVCARALYMVRGSGGSVVCGLCCVRIQTRQSAY